MPAIPLPTRRDEAWKWSDLRAALSDYAPIEAAGDDDPAAPVIARLAAALGQRREGQERLILEGPGVCASHEALFVGPGEEACRVIFQTGPGVVLHLGEVHVAEGGVFRQFVFAEGGRLARIETRVHALQGASVELGGVYVCGRARHADITSQVVHAGARGATRQLVKGAVRSGGRGVFQGKILVERAAQKTDARQHHHALLLEEGAEVDAKPELEIYADDVACAHGAATGALDAEALFYLRQRGLPLGEARALLTAAFLREAIPTWLPQADRDTVEARLDAWLEEQA